jgi:hypothetical protein
MTAASAMVVFQGMLNDTGVITHAPGPNGLPGGYSVTVNKEGVQIILPAHLSMEQALDVNERGMHLDGIEAISSDGTIHFAERNMAILKEILGYECRSMPLSEVEECAKELRERYLKLLA